MMPPVGAPGPQPSTASVAPAAGAAAVPAVAGPPPSAPSPSPEGQTAEQGQSEGQPPQTQSFDPSKSPSEQIDQVGGQPSDPKQQDAKKVTKLPIGGLSGPLPAVILGVIVLIFIVTVALYAFLG
jgi:hypothetical protein